MSKLPFPSLSIFRRLKRRFLFAGFVILGLWLCFFDSYSILNRVKWYRETVYLKAENTRLRTDNEELERQIKKGLSDDVLEHIAREQYGMRRPGEKVYRVEEEE